MRGPKRLALLAVCLSAAASWGAGESPARPPGPHPYAGGALDLSVSGGGVCGAALPALRNDTGRTIGGFAAVAFCKKPEGAATISFLRVDGAAFAVDDDGDGSLGKDETDAAAAEPGPAVRALAAKGGLAPRAVFGLRVSGQASGPALFRIVALTASGALLVPPVASLASAPDFAATVDNRLPAIRFSVGGRNADKARPVLGVTVTPPNGVPLQGVTSTGRPGTFDAKTATFTFKTPVPPGKDFFVDVVLDRPAPGKSTTIAWKAIYGPA